MMARRRRSASIRRQREPERDLFDLNCDVQDIAIGVTDDEEWLDVIMRVHARSKTADHGRVGPRSGLQGMRLASQIGPLWEPLRGT